MSKLDELRNEVDAADDAILAALKRRFAITDRIRELKDREGVPRADKERRRQFLRRSATRSAPSGSVSSPVRAAKSRRLRAVSA